MAGVLIKIGAKAAKAAAKKAASKKAKKETVKQSGGKIKSKPKKTQTSSAKPKNQTSQGASVTTPRATTHQGTVPARAHKSVETATAQGKRVYKSSVHTRRLRAGEGDSWAKESGVKGADFKTINKETKPAVQRTKRQLRANKKSKGIK